MQQVCEYARTNNSIKIIFAHSQHTLTSDLKIRWTTIKWKRSVNRLRTVVCILFGVQRFLHSPFDAAQLFYFYLHFDLFCCYSTSIWLFQFIFFRFPAVFVFLRPWHMRPRSFLGDVLLSATLCVCAIEILKWLHTLRWDLLEPGTQKKHTCVTWVFKCFILCGKRQLQYMCLARLDSGFYLTLLHWSFVETIAPCFFGNGQQARIYCYWIVRRSRAIVLKRLLLVRRTINF